MDFKLTTPLPSRESERLTIVQLRILYVLNGWAAKRRSCDTL
jgi:hypothetical protein